jgi:hypothetical protein
LKKLSTVLLLIVISSVTLNAQYRIHLMDSSSYLIGPGVVLSKISFRGLSVVNDEVVWVSGSRGTVARSINGGKTMEVLQIPGYENSDFRDIEAFDDRQAIVMSSGMPALILKTIDGGKTWLEVFRKNDSAYFFDAMDFWDNQNGMLLADPINGKFILLKTTDSGNSWQEIDSSNTPGAIADEAIFAASGTSFRCLKRGKAAFVTGGSTSRLIEVDKNGKEKAQYSIPIIQGRSSQGTFSFVASKNYWFFAGGDYRNDTQTTSLNFVYVRSLKELISPSILKAEDTDGYKSCVEVLSDERSYDNPYIILTGTSGTLIGKRRCSDTSCFYQYTRIPAAFHVVKKAKTGSAVFLAGANGRMAKLKKE